MTMTNINSNKKEIKKIILRTMFLFLMYSMHVFKQNIMLIEMLPFGP